MILATQIRFLSTKYSDIKAVEIIKNAGFDAYDYTMSVNSDNTDEFTSEFYWNKIKELKSHADAIGIQCVQAHAPYSGNQIRMLPAIIRSMEYASYLGAKVIVVHPITNNDCYYELKDELFAQNMEFYRNLITHAEKLNIKVAVENMFGWDRNRHHNTENPCSHSEEFIKYIDNLNSEHITACVDTGHCQLVHEAPENMLLKLEKRVGALHIHDNTGYDDAHNIPYSGTINWDNVCSALAEIRYDGSITFEADRFFTQQMEDELIPQAVRYLEQVGRSLIRKINNN